MRMPRNVAEDLLANTATTYQYGSITKQFTAMSIPLLAQDGRLTLKDRIEQHLSTFKGKKASLQAVLIHTSGPRNPLATREYATFVAPQTVTGLEWAIAHSSTMPGTMPLALNPGENVKYDNTGYVALARVVEHVSGMKVRPLLAGKDF